MNERKKRGWLCPALFHFAPSLRSRITDGALTPRPGCVRVFFSVESPALLSRALVLIPVQIMSASSTGPAPSSVDPSPPFSLQHLRLVFFLVELCTGIFFGVVWWCIPSHLVARLVSKLYGWSVGDMRKGNYKGRNGCDEPELRV